MQKTYHIILLLLTLNIAKAQQFTENTPIDSVLMTGNYISNSPCQQPMVKIQLDSSLYNYVNGLSFVLIVDSAHCSAPTGFPPYPGDTIILNATSPVYSIPNAYPVSFWYKIKIIGTPTLANQNYPCAINAIMCLCWCADVLITKSITDTSTCTVAAFNKIKEVEQGNKLKVYPNPVSTIVNISGINEETILYIYDAMGQLISEKSVTADIEYDTKELKAGVYFLHLYSPTKGLFSQKIIIQH